MRDGDLHRCHRRIGQDPIDDGLYGVRRVRDASLVTTAPRSIDHADRMLLATPINAHIPHDLVHQPSSSS